MRLRQGLLILPMVLAGCAHAPAVPTIPKTVQVVMPTYVPIPAKLTERCPVAMPRDRTVGEAVRVARARRAALERCNSNLDAIRKIQGKAAPTTGEKP